MKNQRERLSYVDSIYCSDDFFQIMLGYEKYLILFNYDGCMYYRNFERQGLDYVNLYLDDERRLEFPYSNIPEHIERAGVFSSNHITNQILELEKPYLCLFDGSLEELVGYKENGGVLVYSKSLWVDSYTRKRRFVTRSELDSYLQNGFGEEKNKYIEMFNVDGIFYSRKLLSEEEILEEERENLLRVVSYQYNLNSRFGKELKQAILSMDKIEPYCLPSFYLLTINKDGEMHLEFLNITFHDWNLYELETVEIPITKESLDFLKSKIQAPIKRLMVEPKIPLRLNPTITSEQVKTAHQKVLKLSRKSDYLI